MNLPARGNGSAALPPDPTARPAIEVHDIVKRFGDFTAVDHVSFSVAEGEIFGLLGPNGAGKSTLIRMMVTLMEITSGSAHIAGFDVRTQADQARRCIGVIPQAMTSDMDLTLEENLNIYAKLYGVPARERQAATEELLALVDLTKWRDAQTKTLSGRHAAAAGDRPRPGASPAHLLSRRAHHGPGSGVAGRRLGNADGHQGPRTTSPC